MSRKLKRTLSLVLALIMICSTMGVMAFAAESSSVAIAPGIELDPTLSVEARIQNEIKLMEAAVWADLHEQLAAQDALDGVEYFKAVLRPEIERTVTARYNSAVTESTNRSTFSYYFPNGGLVQYYGSLNTTNTVLCMNPDDTLRCFYDNNKTSWYDIVVGLIGAYPTGGLLTIASAAKVALTDMALREIEDAGYYARILHVSWGAGAEQGCYGYGWNTHPYCYVYDPTGIISVEYGV